MMTRIREIKIAGALAGLAGIGAVLMGCTSEPTPQTSQSRLATVAAEAAAKTRDYKARGIIMTSEVVDEIMAPVNSAAAEVIDPLFQDDMTGVDPGAVQAAVADAKEDLVFLIRELYGFDPEELPAPTDSEQLDPSTASEDAPYAAVCFLCGGAAVAACALYPACWAALSAWCVANPAMCGNMGRAMVVFCASLAAGKWWYEETCDI
jgi:hypothetical protein